MATEKRFAYSFHWLKGQWWTYAIFAIVFFALGRWQQPGESQMSSSRGLASQVVGDTHDGHPQNTVKGFILAIWVELKPEKREEWLTLWGRLAEQVRAHEPCTLDYEISVAEDNPNRIFVYESARRGECMSGYTTANNGWDPRYCNRRDLVEVHQRGSYFLEFKQQMADLDPYIEKTGKGSTEVGLGHHATAS